jgi:beta-phosphoglucomutase-like phosphatase (HAD superfamily)
MDIKKLREYFKKQGIDSVIFDMDSTLVDTDPYYIDKMIEISLMCVIELFPNESKEKHTKLTEEILLLSGEIHRRKDNPLLITDLSVQSFEEYMQKNGEDLTKERMNVIKRMIKEYFKDFYTNSPVIFPDTIKILNLVESVGIPIGIYSHAQVEWTKVKIEYIKREYRKRYKKEIELPFFTTDINEQKNNDGWVLAAKNLGFNLERSLVVGDNFKADIEAAISGGCKNLIHISDEKVEIEKYPNICILSSKDIGGIFNNL